MSTDQRSQMLMLVAAVCLGAGIVLLAEFFSTVTTLLVAIMGIAAIVVGVFGLALAVSADREAVAAREVAATQDDD